MDTLSRGPFPWPGVCTAPLLYLNEVMTPLGAEFKDTFVVRGSTCTVHRFLLPLHTLHTGSLCTCWQELVIWNSLQGWAVKSLIGMEYSYGGMGDGEGWRGIRGNIFSPKLIELSGFSPYQRALIFCHIFNCMCFYIRLTRALRIMGLLWWLWPHLKAHLVIDLCWRHA